jgi:hypothetical protein
MDSKTCSLQQYKLPFMDWCPSDDNSYLSANFVGELEHEHLDLEEFLNILTLASTPSHEIQ